MADIAMVPLKDDESSHVAAIGHDPVSRTLRVRYKKGAVHEFAPVSEETHAALMAASSKGSFLRTHIYPHTTGRRV